MIYFTRHGRVSDKKVSEVGFKDLDSVKESLNILGFRPKTILSSRVYRSIQTACYLGDVAEDECICLDKLGIFSDFNGCRKVVDDILSVVEPFEKGGCNDVIVVGHDSMAAVLAMRLSEKRGGAVNWGNVPRELRYLEQGHGLILCGSQYVMVNKYVL